MARIPLFFLLVMLTGCGAHLRTLPVGAGQAQVSTSVGGPLVDAFGTTIPVPYLMTGATYGLTDRVNVHADVHVLSAAYKFLGFTPGITVFPDIGSGRWIPALSADFLVFSDFEAWRLYPEFTLGIARHGRSHWTPYGGLHNTLQTTHAPRWMLSVFAGSAYVFGRMRASLELQWLAANHDNHWTPVGYHGIARRGALSPQVGLTYKLGGRKP